MELRDYQSEAVRGVLRQLHANPVLVAPTGSGKSVMGTDLARRLGGATLWVAHRRELIRQAADHLRRLDVRVGEILAGVAPDPQAEIQVASVQTLARRRIPDVRFVVIDECHHAKAGSYQPLFELGAPVVGLTATPFRLDGKPLGDLFGKIVVAAQVADLTAAPAGGATPERPLHAPRVYSGRTPLLHGVKLQAGDYNRKQLRAATDRPRLVGDIVEHWHRLAAGGRTVCFAAGVEHSRHIARAFNDAGVVAEHLDARTPADQRDAMLQRLASGQTTVVSNCQVLTEGWDLPALACAIIARPTASLNLHLQMIGRVMRACSGKAGALVLDHAGNHHRHGPVTRRLNHSLGGPVRVAAGEPLGLRRCKGCGLMYEVGKTKCPECGEPANDGITPRKISVREGELERVDSDFETRKRFWDQCEARRLREHKPIGWPGERYRQRFGRPPALLFGAAGEARRIVDPTDHGQDNKKRVYQELLKSAQSLRYQDGWASHRYRELFGVWPRGFVTRIKQRRRACERESAV